MIFKDDDTITFVRSHRAPSERPRHCRRFKIGAVTTLITLGVILLVTTGVMINADLGIV